MSKSKINETDKNPEKNAKCIINDFRVWKQKAGLVSENIIESIKKSQSKIKHQTEILNEGGERHDRKKIKSHFKSNKFKDKKSDDFFVSDTVKKIMGDVGKLVMNIRTQEDNLSKVNINALLETTKQIKKSEIIGEPNSILKIKEKEYKLSLEGKLKKPPNYKFLSDSYRKQVNKVFNNYNPKIHLGNIHLLRKSDKQADEQFKLQINEIDEELKSAKNFIYYKSDFNKNKNKSKKKLENKTSTNFVIKDRSSRKNTFENKRNLESTGYTMPTCETMTEELKNNRGGLFNRKNKHKRQEIKRKFPDKENRIVELNLMKNVCEQIDTTISPRTFNRYFMNYNKIKNTDIERQKHTFFGNIFSAHKILTEIQENLYIKKTEEDVRNRKKNTSLESEKLVDKINDIKVNLLSEIDEQEKKQEKLLNNK